MAARKVVEMRSIVVGWTNIRVETLKPRPMQCYRCMGAGHTRAMCTEDADRSNLCYRCGEKGHKVGDCSGPLSCAFCKDHGWKHDHRRKGMRLYHYEGTEGAKERGRKGKKSVPNEGKVTGPGGDPAQGQRK